MRSADEMRGIGHETRFQPGTSGNPRGRPPRRRALAETLREILDGDTLLGMKTSAIYRQIGKEPSDADDPSVARLMLESAIAHFVAKGNPSILAAVLERIDGPAKMVELQANAEDDAMLETHEDVMDVYRLLERRRARRDGTEPPAWDGPRDDGPSD